MSDVSPPKSPWRFIVRALLMVASLALGGLAMFRAEQRAEPSMSTKGSDVSSVAFRDAEGTRHTVAEFRGKVVLVDVWATWCPPCRKSLPEIAELQKTGGDNFVVLPISVDQGGWADIQPFLKQNPQLGLKAFLPDGPQALSAFGEIAGIPTTLVIDREGRLRQRWSGFIGGQAKRSVDEAVSEGR
jgi:thiol-disulfide isomerase/thioredoxin